MIVFDNLITSFRLFFQLRLFVTVCQNFKEHRYIPIYKIYAGVASVVTEKKVLTTDFIAW